MYPQSPSASTGNVSSAALRRGVAVLFTTALVVLSGCGTGKAPVGAIPPAAPSYTVPAGWNSFVDPDHGWFTAYPGGWVVFASANTHAWKNFISDDPRDRKSVV